MIRTRNLGLAGTALLSLGILFTVATSSSGCGDSKSKKGPPAPQMVTASAGDAHVILNWQDVSSAERYIVYRAREPGITKENYDSLDEGVRYDGDFVESPFLVDGLENGVTYFFIVTSVSDDAYEGRESGEVSASPSPWGRPDPLEILPGEAIGLVAGIAGDGTVHAIWARGTGPGQQRIHASFFLDDVDEQWSAIQTLDSANAISGSPALAVELDGHAYTVWRQGIGANDAAWAAVFDPIDGWDAPVQLTGTANVMARNPTIAAGDGAAAAAWTQNYVSSSGGTITGIFGAGYDGVGWSAPERIDVIETPADGAKSFFAFSGPQVVWPQAGEAWASAYTGTWDAPIAISGSSDDVTVVRAAGNELGDGFVLFREANLTDDLFAVRWDSTGLSWDEPQALETSPRDTRDFAIAVCENGDAVAVWTETTALHSRLVGTRYSSFDGAWILPAEIVYESPDGDSEAPSIAVDAQCSATVVWIQEVVDLGGPGTTRNVYSSELDFDDTFWDPAYLVGQFGLSSTPVVVIDGDAEAEHTVLWEYYGASGTEVGDHIWFNRMPDPPPAE